MSALGSGDNTLAMMQLDQQDMVQKKLAMDNLRGRLMGAPDKKEKLREACQGFESVFIQKMWEQMRNNVQKSGYLHSRDEHMYQAMYDAEFSKKMTEAGGIGLADMLYEQLSQRLGESSRTTSPRNSPRLPIIPASSSITSLGSAPVPLNNGEEQAGLPLNNKQIRPLYEDVPVSREAAHEDRAQNAELAEFDGDIAQDSAQNFVGSVGSQAAAVANGAKNDANAEMDFESISQALLAEELAGVDSAPAEAALNSVPHDIPALSPDEVAVLEAALRQNMAEAGRISTAQAPDPSMRLGTAFAKDSLSSADSAVDFDFNEVPRS